MKALGKFLGVIAQILAVVLVIALLLNTLDGMYNFFANVQIVRDILKWIAQFGAVVLVCLVALSAAMKTNLIFTIIVALFVAALLGFTFAYGIISGFLPKAADAAETAQALAAFVA
ncbi:MAG: hypothetical protein NC033_06555 [Clostridiales bacterium]|nr:hypothetical protein [Clostridiales bacterium]